MNQLVNEVVECPKIPDMENTTAIAVLAAGVFPFSDLVLKKTLKKGRKYRIIVQLEESNAPSNQQIVRILKHIVVFGKPNERLQDILFGKLALRTQVAAMILDRKVTGDDPAADYSNLCNKLCEIVGADDNDDFELIAAEILRSCT